jgi:outer membrane lipoprotein carrier protein
MSTGRRLLLLLALLPAAASPALAEAAKSKPLPDPEAPGLALPERSEALLDRIQIEQKGLESLEADFVQHRASEFLAHPEESRGRFAYLAPDHVRWDYVTPKPVALVLDEDEMLTWYQDLGRAEKVKVGRVSSQVFRYLNASGSLDSLMKYFEVTISFPQKGGEPYRLELAPRYARIRKRLAAMTLWIDRALFLPIRVRYVEANGDTTEYRFENMRRNGAVPAERFVLELPPGIEVKTLDLDRGRSEEQP